MRQRYRQFSQAKPRKSAKTIMAEFLKDCMQPSGRIEPNQPRQAGTFVRAEKEGYIIRNPGGSGELTDKGRKFLDALDSVK
jgi:hypothetical protein